MEFYGESPYKIVFQNKRRECLFKKAGGKNKNQQCEYSYLILFLRVFELQKENN